MSDRSEVLRSLIVFAVAMAVFGGAALLINAQRCEARWKHSDHASQFGVFEGCRVRLPDGRWIPDDRLREIDLAPRKRNTP